MSTSRICLNTLFALLFCISIAESVPGGETNQSELTKILTNLKDKDLAIPLSPIETNYPDTAFATLADGSVLLKLLINKEGTVDSVEIAHSSNPGLGFEESATEAALSATFKAPRVHRRKTTAWRYFLITFKPRQEVDARLQAKREITTPDTLTKVDITAEIIHPEPAKYPRIAQQQGIQGTVWIAAFVAKDGKVAKADVHESSGHPILDEAAMEAAYKFRWKPAEKDGRPIGTWVTYKVEFAIDP